MYLELLKTRFLSLLFCYSNVLYIALCVSSGSEQFWRCHENNVDKLQVKPSLVRGEWRNSAGSEQDEPWCNSIMPRK